jgi:hypothetical protein
MIVSETTLLQQDLGLPRKVLGARLADARVAHPEHHAARQ